MSDSLVRPQKYKEIKRFSSKKHLWKNFWSLAYYYQVNCPRSWYAALHLIVCLGLAEVGGHLGQDAAGDELAQLLLGA